MVNLNEMKMRELNLEEVADVEGGLLFVGSALGAVAGGWGVYISGVTQDKLPQEPFWVVLRVFMVELVCWVVQQPYL